MVASGENRYHADADGLGGGGVDGDDDEHKGGRTRGALAGAKAVVAGGGGAGQWRVFRSAREFVRQLGLADQKAWRDWYLYLFSCSSVSYVSSQVCPASFTQTKILWLHTCRGR